MSSSDIYTRTTHRLASYELFSKTTIDRVATFAHTQASYPTYQDFFHAVGMSEVKFHTDKKGRGVPYVDIPAAKPEKGVIVWHLPMGNPLDPNQLYQVASLAGALEEYRVIAFGNPSGKPYSFKQQNLNPKDRAKIAFSSKRKVLVAAELDYLASQNITRMYQVGYSYGAMKAVIESIYAPQGSVEAIVSIEPVAHPRYAAQLLGDFTRSMVPLGTYVNRTELQTFFEARKDSANLVAYSSGLKRRINLAIGYMLSKLDYIQLLKQAMIRQPQVHAVVAWATKSELGNDAHLSTVLDAMQKEGVSVTPIRLKNDKHAVANDVHLTAAIVLEALYKQGR